MIHFIVHASADTVGVLVTDVRKDERLTGWNMESDATLEATARQDIPLGHKIALVDIAKGQQVIKYGVPIGNATQDIARGEHVHTHCLKTARW